MNRFCVITLFVLCILCSCMTPAFAATGDLQVTCEPGSRIFVDNVFKGVSKEEDGGLFIPDLAPGPHTVRVIRKGLPPYEKAVVVKEAVAVEVQVTFSGAAEKIAPLPPETRSAPAPTGSLALRSVPPGAVVLLDGEKKAGVTDMLIEHVKAGRHEIVFQRDSRKVSGTFTVEPEKTLDLRADFGSNVIVNLSEQKKADQERRAAPDERITALPAPKAEQEVPRAPAQAQRAPAPQRVISEAAKPYGELSIEMIVSREVPTFYRDSLVVEFPEAAVAANQLLAPQFLDPQTSGGDTRYLTVPAGRKIACQNALLQKQGPVAKTSGILASVQEGTYALFVSRKRWKIDFYSDKSVFDRPSQESIVIKRGERLRLKIKYAPDQNEMYSIERSTEPVGSRFYEDVDALLSSRKPSIRK